jgi:hypothetical protein
MCSIAGVRGVPRNDVIAAAFDDREAWRQELLDVGPGEEPAVLEDRPSQPRVHAADKTLDPRIRVRQVEHEQRAAWLQDSGKFHERSPLVAARLVHVFEHPHADHRVKRRVFERQGHGIVVPDVSKQRLDGEHGWRVFERESDRADAVLREEVGEMSVAAAPVEHRVAG